MGKILWNTVQDVEVPYNERMDVEGNPNLEWRDDKKSSSVAESGQPVVEKPKKKAAPRARKSAPRAQKKK